MRLSRQLEEALTERVTGFSKSGERFSVPTPKEMGFKAPKTPVGKLPTGKFHLTKSVVKRLREDYLTLMKSGKKVKNQDEAEEWNAAVARFDGLLSRFKNEIELYLEKLEWRADYDSATDEDRRIAKEASEWKRKIGRIQDFYLNPPVKSFAFYGRQDGASKEQLFQHFKHEFPAWDASTKRRARIAWRWLDDLTAWAADKSGVRGAGGKPVVLSRPERRNVRIEGFNISTIGEMDPAHIARLKEALKVYRRRAQKYLPALLKYKLPFEVESETGAGKSIIANAYYGRDRVVITPWGLSGRSVDDLVRTIAHEMGHHLQGRVSQKNWLLWYDYWQGGKKPIDLRKVLAMQKPGESDRDFGNRLKKVDPVLHMRLSQLNYRAGFSVPMMKAEIERGKPVFMASQRMPSAYAATLADEGFAEVIGHLVAYGPRTIPRETLAFLKRIIPGARVESLSGQLEEAILAEKAKGKIRASKIQYIHFTDAKGALGMVKEKKIWQSDYAAPAVYAVAVGGSYSPGVQLSKMGRAPKGRDVAILFTTDEFPDVLNPEEVLWYKKEIRVKTAKIIPTARAIRLLDDSLVVDDTLKVIPAHPSTFDWEAGRVRTPERKPVGRVV